MMNLQLSDLVQAVMESLINIKVHSLTGEIGVFAL